MTAPGPLSGTNPYTGMYQSRQFGVGNLTAVPNRVADFLQSPPATLVTAQGQTPLVEEAEFFGFSTQTITIDGAPSGGTFKLAYDGVSTTASFGPSATNSSIQAALRALGGQVANVTVTGPNGGPFGVTGFTANVPLQLIEVTHMQLTGGTKPNVVVTSAAQQQGIVPF